MAAKTMIAGTTSGDFIKLDNEVLDVWAQEVLFQAQPNLKFESIVQTRTELGTTPGSTIKFLRYSSLTGKSEIAETDTIVTDSFSTSLLSITVTEHAKAVAFTELLLRQSADNVLDRAATILGMHYARERDRIIRDALLTASTTLYSGDKADRASLTANDTFNLELIRAAVETLATKKAPKFGGDAYICFVHPHQSRKLRSDSGWVNVANYADPSRMINGEIGRIDDVRFIETTQITLIKKNTQDIWADGEDTGDNTVLAANAATDVYQAIIVGDWAAGLAEGLPVELRDDGVQDFGRKHSLAYYWIGGVGLIESGHVAILETA